ncbi:MFS transporter [Neorhizobium sp. JUb45]|uniref:MFS transporter n=1 Tax=Neorhizobium sp. JUb45 TaxID=2485113 RepID=UPI0010EAEDAC|nr:MFS transporter [Neorhizobium sp. JUb45]TCQ97165.1 EmrB/QacA subfamily drug resistance transporter [Neorhizobium sp. JUb45]
MSSNYSRLRRAIALTTILTAQLMLTMDFLIVLVALPKIQTELGFTPAGLSWVPNAFALAFGGLLLAGGRLGDIYGQVKAFKIGIAVFVAASLMGGIAGTPFLLILARVLQGAGAALAGPSVLALITTMARDETERNQGLSLFISISSVGASVGLILGGALTDLLSWRWSLLINVPIGAVVLILIGRLVKETEPKPARLDIAGALTATLGSVVLVYAFISAAEHGWTAASTILSFAISAALLVSFFRIEKWAAEPLLDLSLLHSRPRVGGLIVMAIIVGMHFSMLFLIVQYLQQVLGFAPLIAGLAYLPLTATVFTVSPSMPRLIVRFGPRPLLALGGVLVALSFVGFAVLGGNSAYFPAVFVPLVMHAIGVALVFTPGTVAIMEGVPAEHAGAASGLLQMDQQVGGALGLAIIAAVYAGSSVPGQFTVGLGTAFAVAAVISLLATLVAIRTVRPKAPSIGTEVPKPQAAHF